jgi:hypothetical protein
VLPAVSAVAAAAISAAPAPATMTTAATTTTAATMAAASAAISAATAAASPASTSAALGLWPGFVHNQVSTAKILTVQGVNRAIRIFVVGYFDKGEPAGLTGEAIADQIDA